MPSPKTYIFEMKIPPNVVIEKQANEVRFSGPLGSTGLPLAPLDAFGMSAFFLENGSLKILTSSKATRGLVKKLFLNKIQGVTRGFLVYLKIVGVGYRAHLENTRLFFKLGYSHDVAYTVPSSVRVFLLDPTLLCIFGVDKNQVTQIASKLRDLRKPSVYKGKGLRLLDEKIRLKTGKRK